MPHPPLPRSAAFLVRIYRAGLRLYPTAHRERFGSEMEQVFRAQCRDVLARRSLGGCLAFASRTVVDLLCSAMRERLAALSKQLFMKKPLTPFSRACWSLGAGAPVAALIIAVTIFVTLSLPSTYMSSSRILVRHMVNRTPAGTAPADPFLIQTEAEIVTSIGNLERVVERLSLTERYSAQYLRQGKLHVNEVIPILREKIEVRQLRNTTLFEIRVYEQDRQLAADIANALAESYLETRLNFVEAGAPPPDGPAVRPAIVDTAQPGLKPVRPNVPLNIFLGVGMGGVLGGGTAILVWILLLSASNKRRPTAPAPSPTAP